MTFSRANGSGWGLNDKLTSAEANQIDVNQSRAVDGYAGGTYTPTGNIDVSKLRADLQGACTLAGTASLTGVSGASCSMPSGTTFSSAGKTALGGASLPGSNGQTNLGGTTTAVSGATVSIASGATLAVANGASCTVGTSGMTCGGVIALSGIGRIAPRVPVNVPAGTPKTLNVANGDIFIAGATADSSYTLANPLVTGSTAFVVNETNHTVTVYDFGGAPIGVLDPSNSTKTVTVSGGGGGTVSVQAGAQSAMFFFDGTIWTRITYFPHIQVP